MNQLHAMHRFKFFTGENGTVSTIFHPVFNTALTDFTIQITGFSFTVGQIASVTCPEFFRTQIDIQISFPAQTANLSLLNILNIVFIRWTCCTITAAFCNKSIHISKSVNRDVNPVIQVYRPLYRLNYQVKANRNSC